MTDAGAGLVDDSRAFYVYALFDPRESPPRVFYIGKGVGERYRDHARQVQENWREEGESAKAKRIRAIQAADNDYFEQRLVTGLTETEAYRIELELIAAFGVEANGGPLTNVVRPIAVKRTRPGVKAQPGAEERVQMAIKIIKDDIAAMAELNPRGITNADVANKLGLQSTHDGKHRNYLSHSILGILMLEGRIMKTGSRSAARYFSPRNFLRRSKV